MTTNQTIDGVPRCRDALVVLVETFRDALHRGKQPTFSTGDLKFFIEEFNELRVLLDVSLTDGGERPAAQPQGEPVAYDIESAARKLAECMDYSWTHMPEQGRGAMREYVVAIVGTALSGNAEHPAPVAPWFYFVECDDPDYSGLFNHESEAQTQAIDHGGSVVKLWNVPPTWRPTKQSHAGFWQWLDYAYRDGSKGEEPRFTKYNMEVAYSAGASAEQPAPVAVVLPERREPAQDNPYLSDADHEWNAYRDELKRLNPSL